LSIVLWQDVADPKFLYITLDFAYDYYARVINDPPVCTHTHTHTHPHTHTCILYDHRRRRMKIIIYIVPYAATIVEKGTPHTGRLKIYRMVYTARARRARADRQSNDCYFFVSCDVAGRKININVQQIAMIVGIRARGRQWKRLRFPRDFPSLSTFFAIRIIYRLIEHFYNDNY